MKIIFMGTPHFSVLALQELIKAGHEIIAVYSREPKPSGRGQKLKNSPVHELAIQNNIPVYTPKTLKDEAVIANFLSLKADYVVVVAYGMILPKAIIDAYKCLNIHASLLPRWRGAAPIQRAIMEGDKVTGITIIRMDEGLDTGDMLLTEAVTITSSMNAGHVHDELSGVGARLIVKTIDGLEKHLITAKPQQGTATYAAKIDKAESKINFILPGTEIIRIIRGLNPYPGAYFNYQNEKIKILEADFEKNEDVTENTVITKTGKILDRSFSISCIDGKIIPLLVQREGKKIMPMREVLKSMKFSVGDVL